MWRLAEYSTDTVVLSQITQEPVPYRVVGNNVTHDDGVLCGSTVFFFLNIFFLHLDQKFQIRSGPRVKASRQKMTCVVVHTFTCSHEFDSCLESCHVDDLCPILLISSTVRVGMSSMTV